MALKLICLLMLTCLTLMPKCSSADEETTTPAGEQPVGLTGTTVLDSSTSNSVDTSANPESGSTISPVESKTTTTANATANGPENTAVSTTAGDKGSKGNTEVTAKPREPTTKGKAICLAQCYILPCIRFNDTNKPNGCQLICKPQPDLDHEWNEEKGNHMYYGDMTTTTDYEFQHCSAQLSIPQAHLSSKGLNEANVHIGFSGKEDPKTAVYCKRTDKEKDDCHLDCSDVKLTDTVDTSSCEAIEVNFTSSSYRATEDRRSPSYNGATGRHNLGWTIATAFTLLISATFALTNTLQSD